VAELTRKARRREPGFEPLSAEELASQEAAELPDREAMSLVTANVAVPVNAAVAAKVLSDDAVAYADATQDAAMDQGT
jgi:hypothetical protein